MNGELDTQALGAVTVLFGERRGRYPQGNSLLVAGGEETVIVDPSLGLLPRARRLPRADRVVHSHCHEDHIAGSHLFPDAPWHFHRADLPGIRSLDGMMKIYGYAEPSAGAIRASLETLFHYQARPDAIAFGDGDVFDLGAGVRLRVIHAPGHTRGHCFFWIEPDDILYLADVDLSSFGPYYGDAWSDLRDFERTLVWLRQLEPRCWVTFHHIGVIAERSEFLARLDRFEGVIADREERLLRFLTGEPRSVDEIVRHRFVYRPHDEVAFADAVERRTMSQHLDRLLRASLVAEVEPGRFLRYP